MAKVSGIPSSCTVDDAAGSPQDISADVTNVTIATPRNQQDVTGLDKSAIERLGLLSDATFTISGVADFASNMAHDVWKADPTGTRTVAIGLASGAATLSIEANKSDFSYTRAQDGSLVWSATCVLADGTVPTWT